MPNVVHSGMFDHALQGSAPATPAAGFGRTYWKSADNRPYWKDVTGTEYKYAPDPLGTKGDIPIFGTAYTKLGVGSDRAKLEADSTASAGVAWVARQSVRAYNSAALSINSATATALTLDSERWDTNALHSTSSNTSRLTAAIAGDYLITGHLAWASNTTGARFVQIRLNGTTIIAAQELSSVVNDPTVQQSVSTVYQLAATDYVELIAYQDSGGLLNVTASANYSPEFGMVRVA